MSKPSWLVSQLRDRGTCEQCGERPAETQWAGTGELICFRCYEARKQQKKSEEAAE